ncbi:MAG: M14 family metallopeptidase [Acidobacteria bacterium]|nr:M14 family metallopeptidase [Acidobacteriota bacterium]
MTIKSQTQSLPQSRAERTNYEETSRYADVLEFIHQLQLNSQEIKVESFATTHAGRSLPLVILSRQPAAAPQTRRNAAKPVVFIMANIHAGEVEGKEAMQHLMRDVVAGQLNALLDKMILLIAPIYNADGNEKIDINNRTAQNGPKGGVGTRENGEKLDLNRDYMKVEAAEARGLIENVFNRYDPQVVMDLHTTNGSYHGYALTYSPSLNPNTDRRILAFMRDKLFPAVTRRLWEKHHYHTYFYGNFSQEGRPQNELNPDQVSAPKAWATFDHRPRFGNNYEGLRNRLAILSEAYSYLDFRTRVDVTDKFVRAILQFIAARPAAIIKLARDADKFSTATGTTKGNEDGFGVNFELKASAKPVAILVGSVNRVIDPRTNKPRLEANTEARPVLMTEYGEFQATKRVPPPLAYILKPEQRKLIDMLLTHGIVVETTKQEVTLAVEQSVIQEISRAPRAFQGHRETKLQVEIKPGKEKFPAGSFLVSTHQAKAALLFYLLDAESDDGLVNWNFLDNELDAAMKSGARIYPIYRLNALPKTPRVVLKKITEK